MTTHLPLLAGRSYRCQCGSPVFFRNSECLNCGTPLGYDSALATLLPLMPGQGINTWLQWQPAPKPLPAKAGPQSGQTQEGKTQLYSRCANLTTPAACNWLIPQTLDAEPAPQPLCQACCLNRTIPDLNDAAHPDNGVLWGRIELAKRRLFSSLLALGLPVASLTQDPVRGLAFDLLRAPDGGPPVMTGHKEGLITLNLLEADDAVREAVRRDLHEPYRTLLGHFRHEMGHYYWDRLVRGTAWMDGFHALFGDETQDYAASLRRNYQQGPPANWQLDHVSAYASSHPWEDWAECWAHYLHMRDTIDTAVSLGLAHDNLHTAHLEFTPFTMNALYQPAHLEAQQFLDFLNDWTRLTTLLNEMSRSMGQPDFYPFVLPRRVVAKLHFIHLLVTAGGGPPPATAELHAVQGQMRSQFQSAI
jgi:hypothetical protein